METLNVIFVSSLLIFASAGTGSRSAHASGSEVARSTTIRTCLGQNVSLSVNSQQLSDASPQDEVLMVEWIKTDGQKGEQSTMLAMNASGHFLPIARTGHTLQYVPGKGVQVIRVRQADLGTYTIRVHSVQEGVLHVREHTVLLEQQGELLLPEDKPRIYVTDDVIFDQSTNQWHVQLACGDFLSDNETSVTWRTPSNQLLTSTRSEGGTFVLHVPNPVQGGAYSCHVLTARCRQQNLALGRMGDVHVNGIEERVRVVEASVQALHGQCSRGGCGNGTPPLPLVQQTTPSTSPTPVSTSSPSQLEGVVRDGDYILAFRLTPRNGESAYDTFMKTGQHDDDPLVRAFMPPGCLSVDGSSPCDRHYRSKVLDLWDRLSIEKVRLVVYENSSEVAYFEFRAKGRDYVSWLSADRAINSSYSDFIQEPKNYCSVKGAGLRRFYINRNHGGCANDAGWLVVTDGPEGCRPTWGPDPPYPVVSYIYGRTHQRWASPYVRYADVMAIWVKMASIG